MADLTDVYTALQKADAAGDTEGAKQLADYIRTQTAAPEAATAKDNGMPTSRREQAYREGRALGDVDLGEAAAAGARGIIKSPGVIGDVLALPLHAARTVAARNPREQVQGQQPVATDRSSGVSDILPTSENIGKWLGLGTTPDRYAGMEFLGSMAGPSVLMKGAGVAANLGGRALNAAENTVFTGMGLNKLSKAVGDTGPDLINALRRTREIAGVETGAEAAAGVGNVDLSRYAAGYEKGQPYADIATKKAELLKGQAARAEASMTNDAQAIASDIAKPDVQKVGDNLITIAEKEKKLSQKNIIGPKFKAAEELGNGVGSDISGLLNKAGKLIDTIDPDAAAVLSRKLSKFQGETTTPEFIGPGGATFKGKPVTAAPTATLEDIGDIRTAINDAAAKAKAAGSDGDYKRLMELHDEVTKAVKNSKTLSPEAKNAYFDAVETYRTEHAPRFKTGLQVNLFKISKGENGITASNVINKFFKDADTTDNFVALFGKNPSAMGEAQKGMEGLFRDSVIKDGVVDPKKYTKFMEDYGPQIDKLDATGLNIRSKLDTVVADTKTALAPKATIEEVKKVGGNAILPEGPKAVQMAADVNAAMQKLSPEDIDAVAQIARRAQAYKNMKSPATGLDEINKPQFLSTAKRAVSEIYAALAQKLGDRQALRISELLSTPEGTQAFIEQALKQKATQAGRIVTGGNFNSPYASVLGINALAPQQPKQNALAP